MKLSIIALEAAHEVNQFSCGNSELDKYLKETARQHQRKKISKTYVLVDEEHPQIIIGFYTIAIRRMTPIGDMPTHLVKRLPNAIPGLTLARLAVSKTYQRQGYGELLLVSAMDKAKIVAENVGGYALFVDAKNSDAASFYHKYGFTSFPSDPLILVIPIAHLLG